MNSHCVYKQNQSHFIPVIDTVIKTCPCYENYWIKLRNATFEVVEFDYGVEKAFSYRKYFPSDRKLFHFCINCLNEIISSILFHVVEFEMRHGFSHCIYKIKHNVIPVGHCCSACINFVIHRFGYRFFKTV